MIFSDTKRPRNNQEEIEISTTGGKMDSSGLNGNKKFKTVPEVKR